MKTNPLPAFAASLVVLLVATSSGGMAFGQRLAIPDAATATTQEQAWWLDESTAALVPFPSRFPGVQRWTIDTRLHRGVIRVAAMSPDGSRVATGGSDGIIRIWNLDSGEFERAIMAHRWDVRLLAWSPDGRWLASNAVADRVVRVFEADSGRTVKELPGRFTTLVWSSDSRRLAASAGPSGAIFISEGLGEFKLFKEMGTGILALAWSPDGRLAVACASSQVCVLEISSGRQLFTLDQTDQHATTLLAWSPDGKYIASGGSTIAQLSDGSSGSVSRSLGKMASQLCWLPDGTRIAVFDRKVTNIYTVAGEEPPAQQPIVATQFLAWRADPERIVAVSSSRIEVWKPAGAQAESVIEASVGTSPPLFVPGRPIVTGLGTRTVSVWDPVRFKRQCRLEGHADTVTVARWSPDGKLLATGDAAGMLRTWDAANGASVSAFSADKGSIGLLEWAGDGTAIAVAGPTGVVHVFSPQGDKVAALEGHTDRVLALAWGASAKQLATGGNDGKAIVWDVESGTPQSSIEGQGKVTGLDWQRGGSLAVGFYDSGLTVFNPATGAAIKEVIPLRRGRGHPVRALAWVTGAEPRLLFGQNDLVQAVDVATSVRFRRQVAPGGVVDSLSLPGNLAVTSSGDRTVRFWSLADGKLVGFIVDDGSAVAAISANGDVAFDPDAPPDLMAIVDRETGQEWMTLDAFAKSCRWKNNPKSIRLPNRK
jgi:WD40 repeat protein